MAFERGHALLIGVGTYTYIPKSNIPISVKDAQQVRDVLCNERFCGYRPEHVTFLHDQVANREGILAALRELAQKTTSEDTVFLYYSGHGEYGADGLFYMTTHDTQLSGSRVAPGTGISEQELLAALRAIQAGKLIFFFNTCHAGEISPHMGLADETGSFGTTNLPNATADAILASGSGRIIVTACREQQKSWIGRGEISIFAKALVDGLKGRARYNSGYIGAFGLYEYLFEAVNEASGDLGYEQEPELTVLKGVGPFPVALYRGASETQSFDAEEDLPKMAGVRRTSKRAGRREFKRITNWTIKTGGGGFVGHDQNNISVTGDINAPVILGNGNVIQQSAPDSQKLTKQAREKARRSYLTELRATCQDLSLAALGQDQDTSANITLDKIYIDLDTTVRIKVEGKDQKSKKETGILDYSGENERLVSALEAAARAPRLALLGDPGAGKSTFVHRLAALLAAAGLGEVIPPIGIDPDLTPIVISLRDLPPRLNIPNFETLPSNRRQARLLDAIQAQIRVELTLLGREAPKYADWLLEDLSGGHCPLILDGLDEVPFNLRERVREAVAIVIQRYRVERVILTCRVRSYSGGSVFTSFTPYTLAPFDDDKIQAFSHAWYNTQLQLKHISGQEEAVRKATNLFRAALALRELTSNPMLLTSMAIIHQRDIGLPEQRVRLYSLIVDVLIRRWQKYKTGELQPSKALEAFFKDDLRLRGTLERLGYEAHRASSGQTAKDQTGDLLRMRAIEILENREYLGDLGLANEFLDYIDQRAGLLIGRGGEPGRPAAYGFPHRSLQEYLAGCHLVGQRSLFDTLYRHAGDGEGWDLAVQLGFEELYFNRRGINLLLDLAYHICASCDASDQQQQRALLWSGQAAMLMGIEAIQGDTGRPDGGEIYLKRIRCRMIQGTSGDLPPIERCEAGNALAHLGDPREEVMVIDKMGFCFVPGGPFRMGEDYEQHEVPLPGFWIGQYPVTNAQYAAFVQGNGYRTARYWKEASQRGYWSPEGFKGLKRRWEDEFKRSPQFFGDVFDLPNHPVVGVTWYEALAYTRWLNEQASASCWLPAGWRVSLVSEAQWEKAARGGMDIPDQVMICALDNLQNSSTLCCAANPLPSRTYPWGNTFSAERANSTESGIGSTSAAGVFAVGTSPYGCHDLSGNVWEWTSSLSKDYPYDVVDGREDLKAEGPRVIRGGSWSDDRDYARCACRLGAASIVGPNVIGFRCALSC